MAILQNLNEMSKADLIALVANMKQASERKITLKVTDKGGVSMYGLGRFPVTLYASQWDKLIANIDAVRSFVETNRALLSTKD